MNRNEEKKEIKKREKRKQIKPCAPFSAPHICVYIYLHPDFFASTRCMFSGPRLGDSIATVDTEIGAGHVLAGVGQEEGDGAHEVLGLAHLALGDERGPLLAQVRVLVEDLLRQGGEHVAGGEAVDADTGVRPLDGERGGEVADTGLGGVVGGLGLGHVDDGTGHAADQDHAAVALALHEVAGDGRGEEVGTVDVDGPELAQAVDGVVDGLEVLGEAGRGDEVVDLAVGGDHLSDARLHGLGVRDVGVVCSDLGDAGVGGAESALSFLLHGKLTVALAFGEGMLTAQR